MPETPRPHSVIRFGEFEVDLQAGRLSRRGVKVKIREQLFLVLAALLEHPGKVVTREELQQRLWPGDVIVDFELNLNTAIARLREALGDSAERPRFIETLPKRGYRFIAGVEVPAQAPDWTPQPRTRILVLPFANLSGDAAQEYLSDAFTEELITGLAGLAPGRLGVIARTTAMQYKGTRKGVAGIGRELGVDFVVEGSLHRTGGRIAVNVQLVHASDQTHLWAKRYDSELSDMLNVVNDSKQLIGDRIGLTQAAERPGDGAEASRRTVRKPTENFAAFDLYLQGRYHMNAYTPDGFAKAKQCFELAIAQAPEFALAHLALGEIYWNAGFFGLAVPKETFTAGVWSVLRAIEIDDKIAEAHGLLGQLRKELDYNWPDVHREMKRALELDPWSSVARLAYGISGLMPIGRTREAIGEIERALELDPLSAYIRFWLAFMFDFDRQYERGMQEAKLLIEREPASWLGPFAAGHLYRDMKMYPQATAALRKATEFRGDSPQMLGWLGQALVNSGETAEARALLERLHVLSSQLFVPPTSFAWIYLGLGDVDNAFTFMDQAIEVRDTMIVPIKSYAFLEPLRADPRFRALLRKMNLEV